MSSFCVDYWTFNTTNKDRSHILKNAVIMDVDVNWRAVSDFFFKSPFVKDFWSRLDYFLVLNLTFVANYYLKGF